MRASTIVVGLGAVVSVALAQYVNTVVESSTVTVVTCGPEVSTCAGRTTRFVLPSSSLELLGVHTRIYFSRFYHA
jgi:hypothetical protein